MTKRLTVQQKSWTALFTEAAPMKLNIDCRNRFQSLYGFHPGKMFQWKYGKERPKSELKLAMMIHPIFPCANWQVLLLMLLWPSYKRRRTSDYYLSQMCQKS